MNYEALSAELEKPKYNGLDDAAIVEALNAETVEYHVEPATSDLQNYLMTTVSSTPPLTLYMKLSLTYRNADYSDVVRAVAESAIDLANGQIPNVNLYGNPLYSVMMGVLVQAEVWTQAEADGVLNFGRRYRSRAAELGGTEATEQDIAIARLWPQIQSVQTLQLRHAAATNTNTGTLASKLEALYAGQNVSAPTWDDLAQSYAETEEPAS